MFEIIRLYYDLKNQEEYTNFLDKYLVKSYLEKGTYRLSKNFSGYQGIQNVILINNDDVKLEIICRPLTEINVIGCHADSVYIQDTALYKTNGKVLSNLPELFIEFNPQIYIFDRTGVIGKWNTN